MTAALVRLEDVWLPPAQAPSGLPVASPLGGAMLVHVVNPMVPQLGLRRFGHCQGMTVLEAVEAAGWALPASTVLMRLGDRSEWELIRRAEWDITPIGRAELVLLVTLPQGGKGGASQIIAAVATIALAIFAPEIGVALLGKELAGTVAFAGITWGALATVGIVLAGSMVISALLPKPKAFNNKSGTQAAQNPSYSLSAQSNSARLLQPIPERFGRRKFKPDLSAQASFDFINSNQELNEEFCIGMGEYDIEEVGVANNAIWKKDEAHPDGAYTGTYPEITLQFMPPGTVNTLFSNNVVTSADVSNVELLGTNQDGYGWLGPYILNPATTLCQRIEVDLSAPGGLFAIDTSGNLKAATASFQVQVRTVDDLGIPTGDWTTVITKSLSLATRDPIRTTYGADLAPGRYQVQFQRTNAKATDVNTADSIGILAMRGILPNAPARNDVTCIALKARSTKNLNGDSAQQFYVIATRKLPIATMDEDTGAITWSEPTATRSIAWAAAYICRAQNGLRKADNQVNIAKLIALDAVWADRGDTFDDVFDDGGSAWTALQTIMRCGRAEPRRIGRYIDFNRDEPKAIAKAAYNVANMLGGSFNVDYLMWDTNSPDGLWIDYVDERNWEPASVYCALSDSTMDPDDAPHIPIAGIVQRQQAWREGVFMCATNRWRRTFPNFRTELEGRPCFRGDRVAIAHWLTKWGYGGQVVDLKVDAAGDTITLSEPWDHQQMLNDDQPVATLVTPDGYEWGPVKVEVVDDGAVTSQAQVRLLEAGTVFKGKYAGRSPRDWGIWSGAGLTHERPRAMWGTATQQRKDALMVAMKPESGNNVTMATVIDDPRVHYVDGTLPPVDPDDPVGVLPADVPPDAVVADDLQVTGLALREISQQGGAQASTVMGITVLGANDAVSFDAHWKWNDAADFGPDQRGNARTFQIMTVAGTLTLEVRAVGKSGFGPWFLTTAAANALPMAPTPDVADVEITVTATSIFEFDVSAGSWTWDAVPGAIRYLVKVFRNGVLVGGPLNWSEASFTIPSSGGWGVFANGDIGIAVAVVLPTGTSAYF